MHFDWTVNFGSVLAIIAILAAGIKTWNKFESMLSSLQSSQQAMASRMSAHEDSDRQMFNQMQIQMTNLVGSVQRLIGRDDERGHDRGPGIDRRQK